MIQNKNVPPHKQNIGAVYIDINGNSAPNLSGTDIFAFRLRDDGSLILPWKPGIG